MYEPTQVPPTRNVAFKFTQMVPQLTYLERQKPRCKQPSAGPLVDARTNDAPCTPVRPVSPGLPVSENASTTTPAILKRNTSSIRIAQAVKSRKRIRLPNARCSRALMLHRPIFSVFTLLLLVSLHVCMSAARRRQVRKEHELLARMSLGVYSEVTSSEGHTSARAKSHEAQL